MLTSSYYAPQLQLRGFYFNWSAGQKRLKPFSKKNTRGKNMGVIFGEL
jgi:hypothetical protein